MTKQGKWKWNANSKKSWRKTTQKIMKMLIELAGEHDDAKKILGKSENEIQIGVAKEL